MYKGACLPVLVQDLNRSLPVSQLLPPFHIVSHSTIFHIHIDANESK